jgi:4-hydroxybenzoate polyprenyltransferase
MAAYASPAFAEVSDKMSTVDGMWGTAIGINLLAWVCGRKFPLIALLPLPISTLLVYGTWEELNDPYFARAVREELGQRYIDHSYMSAGVSFIGPILICIFLLFYRRRRVREHEDQIS